ncbi:beta-lactamase [Capronia epimyces CBS 606.96]|uniref:Beta-lactamase n=1 Tax=Capronia epimyces CBS 606.96 TaxID=1182542 RepID=W9XIR1_9EURO|nr:beta-lactamase [Capronia epimyces CBS 606.96]EXJ76831.1 beta-lactamase [Capronia epimyces CBS 606.96]
MTFSEQLEAATTPGPDQKIPGAVVIAANAEGKLLHLEAKGYTSMVPETARPITPDTTFYIASCTKLLTTIAVLQNVERGQLDLDDNVSAILPEWKSPTILTGFDDSTGAPQFSDAKRNITLRQLLTHTSGMGYDFISPELKRWREWREQQKTPADGDVTTLQPTPLLFEPGEGWEYSCSIDWAGKIVERVNGGIRLGEYMKKHIWSPLGMSSTGFRLAEDEGIRSRLCATSARSPTGTLVSAEPFPQQNPKEDRGGGGLYSSPNDYIKVLLSLLKNDGTLLKPETVKTMFTPQLSDDQQLLAKVTPLEGAMYRGGVDSKAWNFGLGGILNMEDVDGVCKKGSMSWSGLPNLFWWIDPAAGNCGMYASQLLPPGDPDSMALAVEFRKDLYANTGV